MVVVCQAWVQPPHAGIVAKDAQAPTNTRHFQCDVSAVFYPGDEATLLIALSSSGKSTLMKTIANLCQEQSQLKTKGTLLVGACDPADPRYTVVVFVVRLPLPIRGTT